MAGKGSKPGERRGGRQPGTQNKATADVKAAAQIYGPAAVTRLAELAGLVDGKSPAQSEQAQVAACRDILDRAYGKAPQAVTVDPGDKAIDFMRELLTLVDGKSRGLPATSIYSGSSSPTTVPLATEH